MKNTHSIRYNCLIEWLTSKRQIKGLTQHDLSVQLDRSQSYVSKYENAESRLDVVELIRICAALNADPHEAIDILWKGTDDNS